MRQGPDIVFSLKIMQPIVRLDSGRLADVEQALKWAASAGPCIVDLSGSTFSGDLAEDLSLPRDTALRNGSLELLGKVGLILQILLMICLESWPADSLVFHEQSQEVMDSFLSASELIMVYATQEKNKLLV